MDLNTKLLDLLNKSIYTKDAFSLVELGADPNILNASGYSLLHLLIFNKHMTEAFQLVEHYKANINIKDKYGFTPLYYMLNENYSIDSLFNMIKLGANPNVRNKSGTAPIHLFIRSKFIYALELIKIHPESIHYTSNEGTPIQLMMNLRHSQPFTADNYIVMVRNGADPDSVDRNNTSLLEIILKMDKPERSSELVALSKISPRERKLFTPDLIDYLINKEGVLQLVNDLQQDKICKQHISLLARYPHAKEMVIKCIKSLDVDAQETILRECLSSNSSLNQFFSVQRGWFMTSTSRGTLAQLTKMQHELIDNKIRESKTINDVPEDDELILYYKA
ncbi:ankyrin repeat domain-containing protein [Legionella quateirensis]|uniref:Ankyrin repeat protein n=1 Tax=Legionella quateirensis TaxID=45072 RepID=A0A378KTH1_9GAMM|nr:ankyrin repeat domain-containing protein [Legionella quateirensis]KTD51285.1 ankyrin repeat protein [Legionella quateirensis]STY17469.1 ankyrin repeat protein [Legionella quateirensis]